MVVVFVLRPSFQSSHLLLQAAFLISVLGQEEIERMWDMYVNKIIVICIIYNCTYLQFIKRF